MSRSYRKNRIFGVCINSRESEKGDKQKANRKLRRVIKTLLKSGKNNKLPIKRELSNVWGFTKDGKVYHADATKKDMRK